MNNIYFIQSKFKPAIYRCYYYFTLDTVDNSRIHPRIVVAKEGDTVEIDCSSYLVPGYTPTTWFFNNTQLFGLPYFQGPNSSLVLVGTIWLFWINVIC